MNKLGAIALTTTGVLALAACSSSSRATSSSAGSVTAPVVSSAPATGGSPTVPAASSVALQLSDFPAGWAVEDPSDDSSSGKICGHASYTNEQKKIAASWDDVYYQDGSSGVPAVGEQILVYKTASQANAVYRHAVKDYNACKTFSVSEDGVKFSGTIGQLSLRRYADQSSAFRAQFSSDGESGEIDLVIMTKGNVAAMVTYGDIHPDASSADHYISKAAQKL